MSIKQTSTDTKKITVLLAGLLFVFTSMAQNQDYLDGMPTSSSVINKIKGKSQKDTYPKQIAAFRILSDMIMLELDKYKPTTSKKEAGLLQEYGRAENRLRAEYSNIESLKTPTDSLVFKKRVYAYSTDINLKNYILDSLCSEILRKRHNEIEAFWKSKRDSLTKSSRQLRAEKKMLEGQKKDSRNYTVLGISLLIVWILLRLWIGKQQFDRRNVYGTQEFKNFKDMMAKTMSEELIGWLSFIALAGGLGLIIYGNYFL